MSKIPVVAIFDVGKTNKKLFLFSKEYEIVYEKQARFVETKDEDGDACEDLYALTSSLHESLNEVSRIADFDIKAINYSTYGASFVLLDADDKVIPPLYNYLKAFPGDLEDSFYKAYGGKEKFAQLTASPVLGNLNSGLQLYRLKYRQPDKFARLQTALHLPQYMSFILSGRKVSDMTSIGCHTALWNFQEQQYHQWVRDEGIDVLLAPIASHQDSSNVIISGNQVKSGIGLHDSSAALIPYLMRFKEPFVLISTGTWSISLNPFNHDPLTDDELRADCLSYFSFEGKPVKASRLFAGHLHDQAVKSMSAHFNLTGAFYRNIEYDPSLLKLVDDKVVDPQHPGEWQRFENKEQAYHALLIALVSLQEAATQRVLTGKEKMLFVDGGFSHNKIFMQLLADRFPQMRVSAAVVAQSTALGTALAVHHSWNNTPQPPDLISLQEYTTR